MNQLYIGFSRRFELPKGGFLYIDDKPPSGTFKTFDPRKHSFNPLEGMNYKKARQIADVLYTIYPQGENTLTVRNGRRDLLQALLHAKRLDKLEGSEEVQGVVTDLFASPVLRKVLCEKPNFEFRSERIYAKLDRALLGDFDALVLGLLLMSHYKGQLIVPDLGFYGREAHISLIREGRLIAGVNFINELPQKLRNAALLIKEKYGQGTTFEDAQTLAHYAGLRPDFMREDNDYNKFLDRVMA